MKESEFIFDSFQLMHCKCHRINFRHGGSYIDSPDWIKKKKAMSSILNYGEIETHLERVSNTKLFINKYTWK